jgi:hypothetical protein
MKLILEITCDNAAFGDTPQESAAEIRRLLAQAANKIGEGGHAADATLYDTNGNRVGTLKLAD